MELQSPLLKGYENREGRHLWPFLKKRLQGITKKYVLIFKRHNPYMQDIYSPKIWYLWAQIYKNNSHIKVEFNVYKLYLNKKWKKALETDPSHL